MSALDLDDWEMSQLESLSLSASPREWEVVRCHERELRERDDLRSVVGAPRERIDGTAFTPIILDTCLAVDAELIVTVRNVLPRLLRMARARQAAAARIAELEAVLKEIDAAEDGGVHGQRIAKLLAKGGA